MMSTDAVAGSHSNAPPGKPEWSVCRLCPEVPTAWRVGARRRRIGFPDRNRPDLRRYTIGKGVSSCTFRPATAPEGSDVLNLDLDVDPGREVQALQGVHRLRGVLDD